MNASTLRKLATAVVLTAGLTAASGAFALDDLKLIAPAKPGGGWDQTARSMQEALQAGGIAKAVTVENVAGAGGTLTNQSAVTLEQTTPIARLTGEYEVIVVPKSSDIQNLGQLVEKLKADV